MNFKQLSSGQPKFHIETRTAESTVELRWNDVKHADGYRVFSSEHGQNKFIGEVNTTEPVAKLRGRNNGVPMDYKVKAFRIADGPDNFFAESEIVFVCPLLTPSDLRYRTTKNGSVQLMWESIPDCDGYKLYRSDDGGKKYNFVCYCGNNSCYVPLSEKECMTSFKVRAFTLVSGIEKLSNFSDEMIVKLPSKAKSAPASKIYDRKKISVSSDSGRFINRSDTLIRNKDKCVIMLGGDMSTSAAMQGEAFRAGAGFEYAFSTIREIFTSADFSVAALDTDVNDNNLYSIEDNAVKNIPSDFIETVCASGIDGIALCKSRLKKSPDSLRKFPVAIFDERGASKGGERIKYVLVNNIKIAVISLIAYSDSSETIKKAKKDGAEFVIIYCDWKEKHVPFVSDKQRNYAKQLADNGADIIVGCGTNTLREFDVLSAKDGREVGVAYSLGCITEGDSVTKFEKAGAILCLKLERNARTGKVVAADTGYFPYVMRTYGDSSYAVLLTEKNIGAFVPSEYYSAKKFAAELLGKKISTARKENKKKPFTIAFHGSSLLYNLFRDTTDVFCDRTHLFISQYALCGEYKEIDKKYYSDSATALYWNLSKGFDDYLEINKCDYLAVDFYYAATTPVYKMDGVLYSGGRAFLDSAFYKENKKKLKLVRLNKEERSALIEQYANEILKHYKNKHIILVAVDDPEIYEINGRLVKEKDKSLDIKLLKELQNEFIAAVNPVIINISKVYPGKATPSGAFYAISRDERFFDNIEEIISEIANDNNMRYSYYSDFSERLWLECVRDNLDMIKQSGTEKFFFTSEPVDIIISKSSKDMISSCFADFVRMKKGHYVTFSELFKRFDFDGNKLLLDVCGAVNDLRKKNITSKQISDVLKYNLYLNADIAAALSQFMNENGIIENCTLSCSNLDFYFRIAKLYENKNNRSEIKQLVQAYYNKNKPIRVDVFGGQNLPYIIQHSDRLVLNKAVTERSVLTLFEDRTDIDLSYCEKGSAVFRELSGEMPFDKKTAAEWIVVDFNEAIRKIYSHDGKFIALMQGYTESKFYEHFCKNDTEFMPYAENSPMKKRHISSVIKRFASYLKKIYGNNIILSRMQFNYNYIDLNNRVKPFKDSEIALKNNFVRMLEDEFEKVTECYVIEYSDKFISEHYSVRGKASTATYEELFYSSSAKGIEKIVSGNAADRYVSDMDILSYIERTERIKAANPELDYLMLKQICGDMTMLVK